MNREILNYQFSIFGRFDKFYNNINDYMSNFSKFEKEISTDIFFDGRKMNCYILKDFNKGVNIFVHFDRIDFSFNKLQQNDCERFNDYFKLFDKCFDAINRIAINYNCYLNDVDGAYLKKISSGIKFVEKYGESQEFSLRINNVFSENNVFFNDILIIQDGHVQKENSFESIKALVISCDINTAVGKGNVFLFDNDGVSSNYRIIFNRLNKRLADVDALLEV